MKAIMHCQVAMKNPESYSTVPLMQKLDWNLNYSLTITSKPLKKRNWKTRNLKIRLMIWNN